MLNNKLKVELISIYLATVSCFDGMHYIIIDFLPKSTVFKYLN